MTYRSFETRPVEGFVIRAVPVTSNVHIAGQTAFEAKTIPHEGNFVSSRRKFCFIAKKILFYRVETKIASSAREKPVP